MKFPLFTSRQNQPLPAKSGSDRLVVALLLLAHLIILLARVKPILGSPTEYLLTPGGDGIKTYFALLYYVQFDHGMQFTGMNYPSGELLLYTDGFPLLAWLLKAWKSVFGLSMGGVVAALNCTVLLSSLPASPLVFALLRRCGVGRWYGALTALVIVLLSPQFHRLDGHLTLALPFAIPLLWYLQVRLAAAEASAGSRARWLAAYIISTLLLGLMALCAVLLLLIDCAGRHAPSTKCLRAHCVLSSSSCVGMVLCEPRHPIAPPQQSVLHMSGTMRSYNVCFLSEHSVGNTPGEAIC